MFILFYQVFVFKNALVSEPDIKTMFDSNYDSIQF